MMNRRTLLAFLSLPTAFATILTAQKRVVSDDEIYDHVRRNLTNDASVKGGALEVEANEGVVTLRGTVETEKQRLKAEKLAKKVQGVKSVKNEISVSRKASQ